MTIYLDKNKVVVYITYEQPTAAEESSGAATAEFSVGLSLLKAAKSWKFDISWPQGKNLGVSPSGISGKMTQF